MNIKSIKETVRGISVIIHTVVNPEHEEQKVIIESNDGRTNIIVSGKHLVEAVNKFWDAYILSDTVYKLQKFKETGTFG